jgi:creatinine amidohydrolase
MADTVFMAELSWTRYAERVKQGVVVFLPLGATEQHGPHLPMATDALTSTAVAAGVAREVGGLVAPTVNFGYKSQPRMGGGQEFVGTTSVDASTFAAVLRDVICELARHGVRKVCVINGHYENMMFSIEGIDLARRDLRYDGVNDMKIMRLEYWDFTRPETIAEIFPEGFPGYALEHAAVMETSMMLHLYPHLVDMAQLPDDGPADFPPYDLYPTRPEWVPCSGVLSPPKGASAEKGRLLFTDYVKGISAAVRQEYGL